MLATAAQAEETQLRLRLLDAEDGRPVVGAPVRAQSGGGKVFHAASDTAGFFFLPAPWGGGLQVEVRALGYAVFTTRLVAGDAARVWRLRPSPLVMDGLVVHARRTQGRAPVFVERIPVDGQSEGGDLGRVLERAAGVSVRRSGGAGSFSTVSIRGSTAEQVQVFLDGVPLNRASGGGVDLGSIPLGGIESVEVYRGAVPARFGGNSIGGVVHLRSRGLEAGRRWRLESSAGSYGARGAGGSLGGGWRAWQYLALADISASNNDFRFWDDNGTEYNGTDDGWASRRNADALQARALAKIARPLRLGRLQLHHTFDASYRGIPGISNNQSLHTRFDTRRHLSEISLSGAVGAAGGYRAQAYHSLQSDAYKDLRGEVGIGTQHQRNSTRNMGARLEAHRLLPGAALLTLFSAGRRETFSPRNLLAAENPLLRSRRYGLTGGAEAELPWGRLRLNAGGQGEWLADRFFDSRRAVGGVFPKRKNSESLWGFRLGASLDLGRGMALRGHRGRYRRAPSFFELFGDRGAVIGNTDLVSETGDNWDLGLVFDGGQGAHVGVELAEAVFYRNRVADLIRFVQNSQQVSRPHNIGQARLQGLESRLLARLGGGAHIETKYVYQQAENRAPFSFEKGNDLPNAPRHRLDGRLAFNRGSFSLHYAFSRESRHFLDRANLRPIQARAEHDIGGEWALGAVWGLSWKVRNLGDQRAADLWGYPLPGRSYSVALRYDSKNSSL